jgi:hypothetical protein
MNIYSVIGLILMVIVLGHFFELGPAIQKFAMGIADIPSFDGMERSSLFDLAVRLAYLIAIVGIIRVIWSNRKQDE